MDTTADDLPRVEGKCRAARGDMDFASVALRGGLLVVDCGWVVPEADEDDYESCAYLPFRALTPRPWVGRRWTFPASDRVEAAACYEAAKAAMIARRIPESGDKIGSVSR